MTAPPGPPPCDPRPDDPRLSYPIEALDPTSRQLTACAELGIDDVDGFLGTNPAAFLALPDCGLDVYCALAQRVHEHLGTGGALAGAGSELALRDLVRSSKAARILEGLGVKTLRQFLSVPRSKLLQVSGFEGQAYAEVVRRLRRAAADEPLDPTLLPQRLLRMPVADLGLESPLRAAIDDQGITDVGELLTAPELLLLVGPRGHARIHDAVETVLRAGIDRVVGAGRTDSFAECLAEMTRRLGFRASELLRRRVGIGGRAHSLRELAEQTGHGEPWIRRALRALRSRLAARAPGLLAQLEREAEAELNAGEGVLAPDRLAARGILRGAAADTGDHDVPLRLLRLLFSDRLFRYGGVLTRSPRPRLRLLRRTLRALTRPNQLPLPLSELARQLAERDQNVERGVLLLSVRSLGLSVRIDGEQGEIVYRPDPIADGAATTLDDIGQPMFLEDLHFVYREHGPACSHGRLLERLRADARFVEVGPELWDLRQNHEQELAALQPEVDRIEVAIRKSGHRQRVRDLLDSPPPPERTIRLLTSALRRHPALRDLGRNEFCSRHQKLSSVVRDLRASLTRAGGELPVARFTDNQPPARRRLITHLLERNVLFVAPRPNRIDLLSNYPYGPRRLRELVREVSLWLERGQGYATLAETAEHLRETRLGGDYLTAHLLGDLLRRHGPFELLPGQIVAQAKLELGGWIQHKAREALRQAGMPMTTLEIVHEVPELAEFARGLDDLLIRDPMLSRDDAHYFSLV